MSATHDEGLGDIPKFAPPWDLADALRKSLRGMEHLNVQAIASQLGVSRNTVGNWLSGRIEPDERTLIAWAQLTAVPYRWLISHRRRDSDLRARFSDEELRQLQGEADARDVTLSVYLRDYIQPPIPEEDLELLDSDTLQHMWFLDQRIHTAQKEDPAPKEMADQSSLYSVIMSPRIEKILNRRGIFPGVDLEQQKKQWRRECGLDARTDAVKAASEPDQGL